jgi:hypothetical protein
VEEFLGKPICASFTGTNDGAGRGEFALPANSGFGREIKAVSVGNPDPSLHLTVESDVPFSVLVRGTLELRLTGVGVPDSISVPPAKGG